MDDYIDNGDIVSQEKIPYTEDLDAALLYQLCFIAEANCFRRALQRKFEPEYRPVNSHSDIYYSYHIQDRVIDFNKSNALMFSQIKAYNTKSKGCYFCVENRVIRVFEAKKIINKYVVNIYKERNELEVLLCYEGGLLFKNNNEIIRFSLLMGDWKQVSDGHKIANCNLEKVIHIEA